MLQCAAAADRTVGQQVLEQTHRNGDDLAAIKTRLGRVEAKFDGVDLKGLVQKVDGLEKKVDALTKSLPGIVGDALSDYEM